jgi:two-component system sensor histidine kinase CiaH
MTSQSLFDSATMRLTLWYMVILMTISVLFSVLLYRVASDEFDRALGPRGGNMRIFINSDNVIATREQIIRDSNQRLFTNLLLFNALVLVAGGGASYLLARRTLVPVEEALEAQSRFSSDAAHELRTPLAVMRSEIEVGLRDTSATKTSQHRLLESNLDEVQRMQTLTERLLLLANNHSVELASVDIETVAVEAMNRSIPLAVSKNISIENNVASTNVIAELESLTDVLTILIDNAIKYSPEKSTIVIESNVQDKTVELRVKDQGIGIKQADKDHVFDRFYRADTSRSKLNVEGYGLGLSIAKRLIELQHGTVTVTSTVGKGSTFTIKLPKV